ncbi:hypothetical protein OH77DRAFT_1241052 [Trametes cingulata]|nr:hypothetical protein OH77DRAFT_1241052 [Trametes cingulata]
MHGPLLLGVAAMEASAIETARGKDEGVLQMGQLGCKMKSIRRRLCCSWAVLRAPFRSITALPRVLCDVDGRIRPGGLLSCTPSHARGGFE